MKFPVSSPRAALLAMTALAAAGLLSCQSTDAVVDEGPVDYTSQIQVSRLQLRPDAATWRVKGDTGRVVLEHDSSTLNSFYTAHIHLPRALGKDTLRLRLWRLKMLTGDFPFGIVAGKFTRLGTTGRDTIASLVLDRWSELNAADPDAFPEDQDSSLAKTFAILLVEGTDTLLRAGLAAAPVGLDTARVLRDALIHAATLGRPFAAVRAGWYLGIDSAKAVDALLDLMPKYVPYADTEYLFPTPPVRAVQALSLSGSLYSDSASVRVHGSFLGKKRLLGPSFRVSKGGVDQKEHFDFAQARAPGLTSTAWDLETDAGATLRAFGNAAPGTYSLVVWMDDIDGNADSSRVDFEVLARPDRKGPDLVALDPADDSVLHYDDSVVTIRIRATDGSGVESLEMKGRKLSATGSEYRIVDTIPASGVWTERVVVAKDGNGNASQITVRFLRESIGAIKPKATLVEPDSAFGDTIPSTQAIRHLAWRIADPSGLALVTIGGKNADNQDSIWSADVPVPPTGKGTTIRLQALNKNGNGVIDSVVVVRRKDERAPAISNLVGTRPLVFDSTSAKLVWKVSDDLKLDSVWINGTLQTLRADSTYTYNVSNLVVGANKIRLRAKDSTGNVGLDSQVVTRLPNEKPPVLTRLAGTADQVVAYGTDSILVRWKASGNEQIDSVSINGRRAIGSHDTFALKIALTPGPIPVVATAWNLSHLSTRDSITIESKLKDKDGNFYRIKLMPDGRVWMAQNLRTLPSTGTSTCALSNCEQNGAMYDWSQAMALPGAKDSAVVGYTDASTVQGLCPSGWHVARKAEWSALFKATLPKGVTDSGKALRSDTGWSSKGLATYGNFIVPMGNLPYVVFENVSSGIITIPVPSIKYEVRSYIWNSTESDAKVGSIEMFNASSGLPTTLSKTGQASVRCIENSVRVVIKSPVIDISKPVLVP